MPLESHILFKKINLSNSEWKDELFDIFNVQFQNCRDLPITRREGTMDVHLKLSTLDGDECNEINVTLFPGQYPEQAQYVKKIVNLVHGYLQGRDPSLFECHATLTVEEMRCADCHKIDDRMEQRPEPHYAGLFRFANGR